MNYDRFVTLALKQIADKGRDVILLNKQVAGYDPLTDTKSDGVDSERTVKAVFTDFEAKEIDGQIIQRGDKRCLIGAISPGLSYDEVILDGAVQYKIENIQTVQPGDTVILYKVQVRR